MRIHGPRDNGCAASGLPPSQIVLLTASQYTLEGGPRPPGRVVESDGEVDNAALSSPFLKKHSGILKRLPQASKELASRVHLCSKE